VVCLTPSATELVAAVAGAEVIVGVDEFSRFPAAVTELPKVGSFLAPNLEAILRLRPTLVVMDRVQAEARGGLEAAGLAVLAVRMERVADIAGGLRAVGDVLGRRGEAEARAAELAAKLDAISRAARARRGAAAPPRVLFVVDRALGGFANMVAAGPETYLSELIERAGGVNALAHAAVPFPRISAEEVMKLAPDVILDGVHAPDGARAAGDWRQLAGVRAVDAGRVYVLGDPSFMHPNPRLDRTLAAIAERIGGAP
jgi:iron complex transport system substrate-binding protein